MRTAGQNNTDDCHIKDFEVFEFYENCRLLSWP